MKTGSAACSECREESPGLSEVESRDAEERRRRSDDRMVDGYACYAKHVAERYGKNPNAFELPQPVADALRRSFAQRAQEARAL